MIGALGAVAPPLAQVVPDPVGFGMVLAFPVVEEFVAAVVPKFCVEVCPHPDVAKSAGKIAAKNAGSALRRPSVATLPTRA